MATQDKSSLTPPNISRWWHELWLPSCAAIYLSICLFDFIGMPVYTAIHNSRIENLIVSRLDEKDISVYADSLIKSINSNRQWNPLTLLGGGMFHLAFGSLLTGGAVTRGFSKKSEIEGYYKSIAGDNTNNANSAETKT